MIILNGDYFDTVGDSELEPLTRPATLERSTTGYLISFQSQWVELRISVTLTVNLDQKNRLKELFSFTFGPLDLIDFRGFSWLTTNGTDDDTHAYNTGAYFVPGQNLDGPKQQSNDYRACDQSWLVPVTFVVNARSLAGNSAGLDVANQFLPQETPAGTINSVNDTFTLTVEPTVLFLFKEGLYMVDGVDYTLSGLTISYQPGSIPQTGETHFAVIGV